MAGAFGHERAPRPTTVDSGNSNVEARGWSPLQQLNVDMPVISRRQAHSRLCVVPAIVVTLSHADFGRLSYPRGEDAGVRRAHRSRLPHKVEDRLWCFKLSPEL